MTARAFADLHGRPGRGVPAGVPRRRLGEGHPIPINNRRVQMELTRYLSDNWAPIIERDVDGPDSLPRRIDG